MLDAYIYDGKRTPFGRHAGSLAKVRPDDLLAGVIKKVVEESPIKAEAIDDVYVGCGNQGGEDARCVARHALLLAGLPVTVPGMVFQRNCASGLSAITSAAQAITEPAGAPAPDLRRPTTPTVSTDPAPEAGNTGVTCDAATGSEIADGDREESAVAVAVDPVAGTAA